MLPLVASGLAGSLYFSRKAEIQQEKLSPPLCWGWGKLHRQIFCRLRSKVTGALPWLKKSPREILFPPPAQLM